MRFVVYGAGAIGGVVGGRLAEAGHEVVLIAARRAPRRHPRRRPPPRRPRRRAAHAVDPGRVAPRGPRLPRRRRRAPGDEEPAHRQGARARSQASAPAIGRRWCACRTASPTSPPRCACSTTCTACAWCCPALHLEPGVVEAYATPLTGILDIGRFPHGVGRAGREDRRRLRVGHVRVGAARRHHAVEVREAAQQPRQRGRRPVRSRPRRRASCTGGRGPRARPCLAAAGIDAVSPEEDAARRGDGFQWGGDAARVAARRVVVAEPGPRDRRRSRPTTSTARSCCWAGSTASPPR